MSVRVVIVCDGTKAERPTISLERCRGAFPARALDEWDALVEAKAAGWTWRRVETGPGKVVPRDLCPACSRAVAERSPVNGRAS